MGPARSLGPGGMQLRQFVVPVALVPLLLGLALTHALRAPGIQDLPVTVSVLVAAATLTGLVVLALTVVALKRTYEALESSRERTRSLLEQAPDGVFVADLEGRYTDVNFAGCRMLGYTREEIVGKRIVDLLSGEDVERLWQARDRLRGGNPEMSEWSLRCKDGRRLPVEVNAKILPDGRWQALVRDITERKRLEQSLRSTQERLELALLGAGLGTWDWNVETGEVVLDARWGEIRGLRPEQLDPRVDAWTSRIHPDDLPRVQKALIDHFQGLTERYTAEHRVRTPSGDWLWVSDLGKVTARNERGEPARIVGVELDVNDRKRQEAEQKFLAELGSVLMSTLDHEELLSAVARSTAGHLADLCLVEALPRRGQPHRVAVAHRDPVQAPLAQRLEQLQLACPVLDPRQPPLVSEVKPELAGSMARSDEHRQVLRDLGARSLMTLPLVSRGEAVGSIAVISTRDYHRYSKEDLRLLERVAARAALALENSRLYRIAQHAIQMRDDVLGIVAHDLRNPLGAILIQTSILRHLDLESHPAPRKAAEMIERSARRMNRLIQDLLDVARMDGGRLSLEQARVSTRHVVADAVAAEEALASAGSLELQLELAPDLPDVWADRDRLAQVFENLIGNAIKFTGAGGRIAVGAASSGGEVLFRVTDTGPGIAAEDVDHVFDRFWQARKAGRRGAGLGLPIVKGIVDAHGGRIWVESTAGQGSTFFFTIPAAPQANARP